MKKLTNWSGNGSKIWVEENSQSEVSQNTVTIHNYTNGKIKGKKLLQTIERNKCS